jgi:4,5-dihydroxyphthalate decarboxylase
MLHSRAFDISELSFSKYAISRCKPKPSFIALPIFLSRMFRHGNIFVRTNGAIKAPENLRGKRVGCKGYSVTAAVWFRGILYHEYGVRTEEIEWVESGNPADPFYEVEQMENPYPPQLRVSRGPAEQTLEELLLTDNIQALFTPQIPPRMRAGNPDISRLFADYKATEADYYRRTQIYPIMHVLVMREELHRKHPWLAANIARAFVAAKRASEVDLWFAGAPVVSNPWHLAALEEAYSVLGSNLWPYGIEPNRPTLEALLTYLHEQYVIPRPLSLEEIFAPLPDDLDLATGTPFTHAR